MKPARRPRRKASPSGGRNKELALIHIGAQEIGLRSADDDSAYRDMLWTVARVRSAADLDTAGREKVIEHLKAKGWKAPARKAPARYQKGTPAALVRWLWTQLHKAGRVDDASDRALRRYIAAHAGLPGYGPAITEIAPQHLDRREVNTVIEQLKRWLDRADPAPESTVCANQQTEPEATGER